MNNAVAKFNDASIKYGEKMVSGGMNDCRTHVEMPEGERMHPSPVYMLTCSSLSGLLCSCQNPTACPISWTTVENLTHHGLSRNKRCPPGTRPIEEQQLCSGEKDHKAECVAKCSLSDGVVIGYTYT